MMKAIRPFRAPRRSTKTPAVARSVLMRAVIESLETRQLLSATAVDDNVSTPAGTPITVPGSQLLANDSDANVVQSVTQPGHGTVTRNPDGSVTYTPTTGFSGQDSFTYTAADTRPELSIDPPAVVTTNASGPAGASSLYNAGDIVIASYQFEMHGGTTVKPSFSPLHITAANSLASPGFLAALANGISIGQITLTTKDALGRKALVLTFKNVYVANYTNAADAADDTDSVDLQFLSFDAAYYSYNADGTARTPQRTSFDRTTGAIQTVPFSSTSDLTNAANPPAEILSFGSRQDVAVEGAELSYQKSAAGPLVYNPFKFQARPNIETAPVISSLMAGVALNATKYVAKDAATGITATYDIGSCFISGYSISGDAEGNVAETYEITPASVTQTFSKPSTPSNSATWNSGSSSGTSIINLGTSSVTSLTQAGDVMQLHPNGTTSVGGAIAVDSYDLGFDNPNQTTGQLEFNPLHFQTDFGPHSPGLLTSIARGATFTDLALTRHDTNEVATSTLVARLAFLESVRDVSDGSGHITELVTASYAQLLSSLKKRGTLVDYANGSWDRATGTGTGDFVDQSDLATVPQAPQTLAATRQAPVPNAAPTDLLDFGSISGGGQALLRVTGGEWTATNDQAVSLAQFGRFTFTAPVDAQTPALIRATGSATPIPRVVYTTYDVNGNIAAQYALGKCLLTRINVFGESDADAATARFTLVFSSIAHVVAPSTTVGVKTYGFGWDQTRNAPLNVKDATVGITTTVATLDSDPGFTGQQLAVPQGSSSILAFQVNAGPNSQIDGQLLPRGFYFGARPTTTGTNLGLDDLVIKVDKSGASLGLLQYLLTGRVLDTVVLTSRDDSKRVYTTWTMRNVSAVQYSVNTNAGDVPTEEVHLRFQKVDLTYTPYSDTGSTLPPITATLDASTGTSSSAGTPAGEQILTSGVGPANPLTQTLTLDGGKPITLSSVVFNASVPITVTSGGTGSGAGTARFDTVSFTADTNSNTAILLGTIPSRRFSTGLYELKDATGKVLKQFTLSGVLAVTGMEISGEQGVRSQDSFTLTYNRLSITTKKTVGGIQYVNNYGWDRVNNTPDTGSTVFADFEGTQAVLTGATTASAGLPVAASPLPSDTATVFVNVVAPASAASATSTVGNGSYKAGAVIPITVTFTGPVNVTGTPTLTLNDGAVANYDSGSGTSVLTFKYVVVAGQNTSLLDYASTSALGLNGGTIADKAGGAAAGLTLPSPGAAGSLAANKSIAIDTTPPTVTINQGSTQVDPTGGSSIVFDVKFSESVIGFADASDVSLSGTAGATTATISGTGDTYTITVTGMTADGTVIATIPASGATDAAGNSNSVSTSIDNTVTYTKPRVPAISISDVAQLEGNSGTTTFQFKVTRDSSVGESRVDYTTQADTATGGGSDYDDASGTITFKDGESEQYISVNVKTDTTVEKDEVFEVVLSNPVNATISDDTATGTIQNDDIPGVRIDDVTRVEGNSGKTAYQFKVTRDSSVGESTVNFSTASDTATGGGSDYDDASGVVTFKDGETTQYVTVNVNGDTAVEADESFKVVLSQPANATLTDDTAIGTIQNDDSASFRVNDVAITEGNSGTKNLTFTVTLAAASPNVTTVKFATANNTAGKGSDYLAASGTLTFPAGVKSKTITVKINGDKSVEPDETFFVKLSSPTGGATIADGLGVGTILNDDFPPKPKLSINNESDFERTLPGVTKIIFRVSLDKPATSPVTVRYATADGTAKAGGDYVATTGTLTFQPGQTVQSITVQIIRDAIREADETFYINLTNLTGPATLADGQGLGKIKNDD